MEEKLLRGVFDTASRKPLAFAADKISYGIGIAFFLIMKHSSSVLALDALHLPWRPIIRRIELGKTFISRATSRPHQRGSVRCASGLFLSATRNLARTGSQTISLSLRNHIGRGSGGRQYGTSQHIETLQGKTLLRLPDLEQSKTAVLHSLGAASSQES